MQFGFTIRLKLLFSTALAVMLTAASNAIDIATTGSSIAKDMMNAIERIAGCAQRLRSS